jgi:hypothetical protein
MGVFQHPLLGSIFSSFSTMEVEELTLADRKEG